MPDGQDYHANLNPNSLERLTAYVEPSLRGAVPGTRVQFERLGYFCVDPDSTPEQAGVQSRGVAGRHLGEDSEETVGGAGCVTCRLSHPSDH